MSLCKFAFVCLSAVPLSIFVSGQSSTSTTSSDAARLPVTRVILYKNGVGYFEHAGEVRGNQDVNVDFTTAQLNDVLKSLTVLDLGKGRITGVSYNSTAPLERQLGLLHLPVGENPTTAQFLDALRGARVEVHSPMSTAIGRVLSIEERQIVAGRDGKSDGDDAKSRIGLTQISLVSDTGEVHLFDLTPTTTVRVLEKEVNEEVGKYLGLVASTRDQALRRMTISTAGDGERNLLVSYISEVPVWKSTYRIVIPKDGKPLLQGWAIVDNTVGEDWKNVELSLVAGAPQSFVQELSQPYYTRRPVVPLPENAMLNPQTHEATIEEQAAAPAPPPPAAPVASPKASSNTLMMRSNAGLTMYEQMGMASRGNRFAAGGGAGRGAGVSVDKAEVAGKNKKYLDEDVDYTITDKEREEFGESVGQSQELGDLFEYKLKDRVTIRKNQSALVPILQSRIDAEKVSVWNPTEHAVLRALWVDNTSTLTLDGGSFNVLEGDAFAGEGLTDAIKPGEKRLMSYAADLAVLADAKGKADSQRVTKVFIDHGVMTQSTQERQENTYTIRNRDTAARTIIIEHPARSGWKLTDDDAKPVESSASFHRFRLSVEPKKTATLVVKEFSPITNRYEISNLTDEQIRYFMAAKMIDPETDRALHQIVAQKNDIALMEGIIKDHKAKVTSIGNDQQRVRENMKALKGSPEEKALIERYVRELNEQEDRVQALQRETADWEQKRDAAQSKLNETIQNLKMEVTL